MCGIGLPEDVEQPDLTVAGASPLFNDIRDGKWCPDFNYKLSEEHGAIPYWLVDGIYPRWSIFAKPLKAPTSLMERHYTSRQESVRKDIERCFGVLQARFNVLRVERKMWYKEDVIKEGMACVILHNMLVEHAKRGNLSEECDEHGVHMTADEIVHERYDECISQEDHFNLDTFSSNTTNCLPFGDSKYCSLLDHVALQTALMKHLWDIHARTRN
jgi:Plant transposon protein